MTGARGERGANRRTRKKGRLGKKKTARRPAASQRHRGPSKRSRGILLKAVAHPLRRRMLYAISEGSAPLGPAQLAKELDLPLGLIAYHAAVLQRCGAVEVAATKDG